MSKLLKVDVIVARLIVMCVFLPQRLQVFVAIGASVYFVARSLAAGGKPAKVNYIWALVLGSSYLLYAGAAFLTQPPYRDFAFRLCERMSSFILLPLVFAIISQYFRGVIAGQLRYFVYGCLIVCAMGNADFLYHHFIVDGGREAMSHVSYRTIFEPFTGIHPTYMSVYLSFAICITGIMWEPRSVRDAVLKHITIYTLIVFLLALFAKSPILAMGVIAMHFLYEHRGQIRKYIGVIAALAGVVATAFFFIPFIRQRATEMLGLFGDAGEENITQNSVHTRRLIWDTDMSLLHHYWLGGTGPGRLLQALHQRYFFHSVYLEYPVGYFDPHSQYFSHWLSFGIAGIITLTAVLVFHFRRAIMAGNRLYLYLLLILGTTFFTETFLARQHGVLFYAIFTSLFFFLPAADHTGGRR